MRLGRIRCFCSLHFCCVFGCLLLCVLCVVVCLDMLLMCLFVCLCAVSFACLRVCLPGPCIVGVSLFARASFDCVFLCWIFVCFELFGFVLFVCFFVPLFCWSVGF